MWYINSRKQTYIIFTSMLILLIFAVIVASGIGIADISFGESGRILFSKIPFFDGIIDISDIKQSHIIIITKVRYPRIILSVMVGAGLAVVGATYQGIFRNPMADPFIVGTSSGAALGAALAIMFLSGGFSIFGFSIITVCAFAGAILITLLTYNIASIGRKTPVQSLLLAGVAINYFVTSLISLLMVFKKESIERIIFWTMGSVATASWQEIKVLFPILIIVSIAIYVFSRELNNLLFGDEVAGTLGVDVDLVKKILLVLSSILVAAIVSVSGIIGFVGLIIPHIVRMLTGPDNKNLLPLSFVSGGVFTLLADTVARSAFAPSEIPIGVVTAILGAPYFIYLLNRSKKGTFS